MTHNNYSSNNAVCLCMTAMLLSSVRQCTYMAALVWILHLRLLFQVESNQKLSRFRLMVLYCIVYICCGLYWDNCMNEM